ncbi:NAD(P)-binding domain-containing protein [Actinospica durhamensis]|uniref:NAD(P)-binding domain-containing protein n=1 Tax=Actinospica durhamensis TaxID=1508375 RepID=A0A941ETT3_9ACTN|nr:NAD(P)-binding domain-containing protein [Actinospica durhamensis]MBR7837962.1 NAD(P)-binding domain-containing protein [Actinospica durhamensis]
MRIGIIGAGLIGTTAAGLFARAGHQVTISNSRGPESLADAVARIGHGVRAASVAQAAACGEVVLLAIPLSEYRSLPAEALSGRIVIDAMNHDPRRDRDLDLAGRGSSELVADHLPGARLVKAFNTLQYQILAEAGRPAAEAADRLGLPLTGDDPEARSVVADLIEELGFTPVDLGALTTGNGRRKFGPLGHNSLHTAAEERLMLTEQG